MWLWKDYMKIKFNSDDTLPLSKPLKFGLMTKTIRSVFTESGKFYPQLFLHDTLYELDAYFFFLYKFFGIYKTESEHWFNLLSKKQKFDTK